MPLTVWDQSDTHESREFLSRFSGSHYFKIVAQARRYRDIERAIDSGQTLAALIVPADFADRLVRLGAEVAPQGILRYHRSLLRDRALLSHPLNPRLVAEQVLFGYRQAVLGD